MSRSAPPPASSASQKCAACGPLWPSRARKVVTTPIAPASIGSCAPVRHHACVGDVAQAERVELPDEPGAEHPDPDGHQYPTSPAATMVGARPALRARKSSMIVLVAVAPTRVTPRFMTSI